MGLSLGNKEIGVKRVLIGIALGGAVVYFFDPDRGTSRRQQLLQGWAEKLNQAAGTGRTALSQASDAVKPQSKEASKQISETAEDVKERLQKQK